MAKKRKKRRVNIRFFIFVGVVAFVLFLAVAVVLLFGGKGSDTIRMGAVNTELAVSGVIIRDETVVQTDKYEKISFNVVEGQAVNNDTLIATIFKRGYQDESMIAILNLQKEIYAYQRKMIKTDDPTLANYNAAILETEASVRNVARGYDDETDMLSLEQRLKTLQQERIDYLKTAVTPDQTLSGLYNELADQQESMKNWTTEIINTAGSGVVSFYFDGYEQVLNANKLNTVNASLVSGLVSKSNTADSVESTYSSNLYRLVSPNHWFLAYTTAEDDPLRVVAGEQYYVTFTDYSDSIYLATAREPIVYADEDEDSTGGVVNLLEFYVDIGQFVGIRTVNATIVKSAQGLVVDTDSIVCELGLPYVYVRSGDQLVKVQVDVLTSDGNEAVITAKNGNIVLAAGQKVEKQ